METNANTRTATEEYPWVPCRMVRDGKEVIVMSVEDFNRQFKKKRVSQKQKILQENGIDLKYLRQIQYRKKEGTYSFKIMNIPNIDELKKLVDIQEGFPSESDN